MFRSSLRVLVTFWLALPPAAALAQGAGSEFQVNSYTTGQQRTSDPPALATSAGGHLIAGDASGSFVVVWASYGQDGSDYGVFGQRYDRGGELLGKEFRVNSYTTLFQHQPAVASDAAGNFVVVWASNRQDGSQEGVFGQRFDSAGARLGGEFRVNSYTISNQRYPDVASDATGNFVVVWSSYGQEGAARWGVYAQRYDSQGGRLGDEFRVNTVTVENQRFPSVASDAVGNFVVAWQDDGSPGRDDGIFAQRFDDAGNPRGPEFRVNTYTTAVQSDPSIASDADGNFVVAWDSKGQDGSSDGVFAQRFESAGARLGGEFRVNTYTPLRQENPSVASDASGNFMVVWSSSLQDGGGDGSFAQRYDNAGVARGSEFRVNSYTTGNQAAPVLVTTGTNEFVAAWESRGQDGSGLGVFGRRFDFSGDTTPPSVRVAAPNGGEKIFEGTSYLIRWFASDDVALASLDVAVSADGGETYLPIAECQDLPGSATSCLWLVPGPLSHAAYIRVVAEDASGNTDADQSDDSFKIHAGAANVTVVKPNTNVRWQIGSVEQVKWTHNLGVRATFRIELDRDDDGIFEEMISEAALTTNMTQGRFSWTVTGPPTNAARVRVAWNGNPAGMSDTSDVTFQIRPAAFAISR